MQFAARAISYLFHPIFMPLIGLWLAFNSNSRLNYFNEWETVKVIYILFAIHTILLPLLSLWVMKRARMISSFQLPTRKERTLPYIMTILFIGMAYYNFNQINFPEVLMSMMFGMIILLGVALGINFFWKISMHTLGAGALAGGWLALSEVLEFNGISVFSILIIIVGLVGTARLVLHAHKSMEVYAGAIVGFFVQYIVMVNLWAI